MSNKRMDVFTDKGIYTLILDEQQQKIEQLEHQNNVLTSKLSASAIELQRAKRLLQASQRKVYITGILFMCALVMALALAIR